MRWAGDVAQLGDCLSYMHEAMCSVPSTAHTEKRKTVMKLWA